MKSNVLPFADLLSNIVDNRGRTCPTSAAGIPLIATNCISNDALYPVYERVRYVSGEIYDTWFRGHPQPGDLLFVTKGSPGRVCMAPDPVDFCIAQDMVAIRANASKIYPKFLLALLRSEGVQRAISNMHVGTLIPHFKKGDFGKLFLTVPSRHVQEAIGDMYFELSTKIDLNRRMNETLETFVQGIFKSWFVDFEPVRAKTMGEPSDSICRRLGLSENLLALFPDRFQDSLLGKIPEGWEVRSLDDIADYLNGLALQKYAATNDNSLPIIKIAQLRAGHITGADRTSASLPEDYVIQDGDVLFSWSGSLEVEIWCGGRGALNQHLFKVSSNQYPKWFYYLWTKKHLPMFRSIAANKATTMGHIQRRHLAEAKVVVPMPSLLKPISKVISPLIERGVRARLESNVLAGLRDALLPKLLSGEIPVPITREA